MAHTWSVAAMIYVLYTMLYIVLHHNSFCIEFSLSANRSRQFENITVRTADNDVAYPLLDKFELNVTNVLFGKMKSSFYGKQRGSTDPLGVMSIQHESQRLSARLRWLSNDELGITNMQVIKRFYDFRPIDNNCYDYSNNIAHLPDIGILPQI